jgi:hypothetical protein
MKFQCKGMVSYKWIEACIRDNILHGIEDFIIAGAHGVAAKSGAAGRRPGTGRTSKRSEFTREDDQILLDACKKQVAIGGALQGNKMYDAIFAAVTLLLDVVNDSTLNIRPSRGGIVGSRLFQRILNVLRLSALKMGILQRLRVLGLRDSMTRLSSKQCYNLAPLSTKNSGNDLPQLYAPRVQLKIAC